MRLRLPAGAGSGTSDHEGAACPALCQGAEGKGCLRSTGRPWAKWQLISGSSLEANEKAEKVFPEQVTHPPGTSSQGPNLHALCPPSGPRQDPSNLRSSFGVNSAFFPPWDHLLPSSPAPHCQPTPGGGGRGRDSQQQLQEMNESISL